MLPLLVGLVAIFYFLVFRPERKRQKARTALLASLRKNDRVVTTSGIHGTVTGLDDSTVTLRVADQVKLTFDRSAVGRVVEGQGEKDA